MAEYHNIDAIADRFQRNPRTVRDWITRGCKTPDGTIRLQAAKLGKSWVVKKEWLDFFEFQIKPRPILEDMDLDE